MTAAISTTKIDFNDASYPLGGYGPDKQSKGVDGEIETNVLSFSDCNGEVFNLISIDALYPGDLTNSINLNNTVICASHTHYSPMIDSGKPLLGRMSGEALQKWENSILKMKTVSKNIDRCNFFEADVRVHTYRRLDSPRNFITKRLSRRLEFYPNSYQKIDSKIYVWVFKKNEKPEFAIVYHAGHPVSRSRGNIISADYIGAIKDSLRKKFNLRTILFFQGCAGDIRPNIVTKRKKYLPEWWLNKIFKASPSIEEEKHVDKSYTEAIENLQLRDAFECDVSTFKVRDQKIVIKGNKPIAYKTMLLPGKFEFHFLPFEVSHHFHLETIKKFPERFLVSCCNDTIGYLPHPSQLPYSGYEVDSSLKLMGLTSRQELVTADFIKN